MAREPKYLDYHDVLLYRSDVDLLKGKYWLNDQIVAFFFEYLQVEKYANHKELFFCGGALSYLLLHGDAMEMEAVLAPMKLKERELIVFACNDNPDPSVSSGGSHWSLLTFTKHNSTFRHYNSAAGMNEEAARALAKIARKLLGDGSNLTYNCARAPQQINSYDCGVYMLGMADIIAESFLDDKNLLVDSKLRLKLNPDAVQDLRSHILGLITERAVGPSRDPKCDEEAEHIPSCSNAAVDD